MFHFLLKFFFKDPFTAITSLILTNMEDSAAVLTNTNTYQRSARFCRFVFLQRNILRVKNYLHWTNEYHQRNRKYLKIDYFKCCLFSRRTVVIAKFSPENDWKVLKNTGKYLRSIYLWKILKCTDIKNHLTVLKRTETY